MRRLLLAVLSAVAVAMVAGGTDRTTVAHATVSAQPPKVAVILFENHTVAEILGSADAGYFNNTLDTLGINVYSNDGSGGRACDYPNTDTAPATGTWTACTAGMFVNWRYANGVYRKGGSAPEYAFLTMGADANVTDTKYPDCPPGGTSPSTGATCPTTSDPNGGVVGYPATGDTSGPANDLISWMEGQGDTVRSFYEDYPGDASTCSTIQWQTDASSKHNYYARKHAPEMLVWRLMPDAAVVSGKTPASAPSDAQCRNDVRNFPGNTPATTTEVAQNFAGTEGADFGDLTFITPSMCHDMHNGNSTTTCRATGLGCTSGACGSIAGGNNWLSQNLPGIRKDVGQDGVVIVTFDEGETGDGGTLPKGVVRPFPTWIVPGTDASGNTGTLTACTSPPCTDDTHIYSTVSTLKALLVARGGSCTVLDNTVTYSGQAGTARATCNAETAFDLRTEQAPAGPSILQTGSGKNDTTATTLNATFPAATAGGSTLVAALAIKGTTTSWTPPTGWTKLSTHGENETLLACFSCASVVQATGVTFTFSETHVAAAALAEVSNGLGTLDVTAHSGTSSGCTTASTGTTATTTAATEIGYAALGNNQKATFGSPTGGYTLVKEVTNAGGAAGVDTALLWQVLSATGTQNTTAAFTPSGACWGTIATTK